MSEKKALAENSGGVKRECYSRAECSGLPLTYTGFILSALEFFQLHTTMSKMMIWKHRNDVSQR